MNRPHDISARMAQLEDRHNDDREELGRITGEVERLHDLAVELEAENARLRDVLKAARERLSYSADTFNDQGCQSRESACLAVIENIDAALNSHPNDAGDSPQATASSRKGNTPPVAPSGTPIDPESMDPCGAQNHPVERTGA